MTDVCGLAELERPSLTESLLICLVMMALMMLAAVNVAVWLSGLSFIIIDFYKGHQ